MINKNMKMSKIKRDLILTSSSPSHDLSNLLFLSKYSKNLKSYSIHFFYFLNKPSKYINNNPEQIYKFIKNPDNRFIKIENNYFSRLYGFFIINKIIFKTFLKNKLNILQMRKQNFSLLVIQPRPYWLKERFGILSKLILNYETIIVGDGVGSECLTKKPFWLKKNHRNEFTNEKIIYSYFIFSTSRDKKSYKQKNSNFYKYTINESKNCFKDYSNFLLSSPVGNKLNSFVENIIFNTDQIYFLLTSTFSEYGRCSLNEEVNLYRKELKNLLSSFNFKRILIKPHPLSSIKKKNLLLNLQEEINLSQDNHFDKDTISKNFELITYIPIEVLTTLFINKGIKINILSSSAALIPSLYAFSDINYKILFGRKKIENSFINKDEILKRNKQEDIIKIICSNIKKQSK